MLIHSHTLCRQRCQTYWRSCLWLTVINVSQQPLAVWFYLKHHKGALSANICSIRGLNETQTHEDDLDCSDASLNVFGILLPSYHIVCVKGNHTDIWLNYELPGGMRWFLLSLHKVGITLTASVLCREKSFVMNHWLTAFLARDPFDQTMPTCIVTDCICLWAVSSSVKGWCSIVSVFRRLKG